MSDIDSRVGLVDARRLALVERRWIIPPRWRARQKLAPCTCETMHNHCYASRCLCLRHDGETGAS